MLEEDAYHCEDHSPRQEVDWLDEFAGVIASEAKGTLNEYEKLLNTLLLLPLCV